MIYLAACAIVFWFIVIPVFSTFVKWRKNRAAIRHFNRGLDPVKFDQDRSDRLFLIFGLCAVAVFGIVLVIRS